MNPPRNRKGETGNPPPKGARASALPDGSLGNRLASPVRMVCVGPVRQGTAALLSLAPVRTKTVSKCCL